jgi:hypothetical protein
MAIAALVASVEAPVVAAAPPFKKTVRVRLVSFLEAAAAVFVLVAPPLLQECRSA